MTSFHLLLPVVLLVLAIATVDCNTIQRACYRVMHNYKLVGEQPLMRQPTDNEDQCLETCVQVEACYAAVFYDLPRRSKGTCELFSSNTRLPNTRLRLQREGNGNVMIYELTTACRDSNGQMVHLARSAVVSEGGVVRNAGSNTQKVAVNIQAPPTNAAQFSNHPIPTSNNNKQQSNTNYQQGGASMPSTAPTWQNWGQWTQCPPAGSYGANTARQTRSRQCSQYAGCMGQPTQQQNCQQPAQWQQWGSWSQCSSQCGQPGTQSCSRSCSGTQQSLCPGLAQKQQYCQKQEVCAQWTAWSAPAQCSVTCGYGRATRQRRCQQTGSAALQTYSGPTQQCQGSTTSSEQCVGAAGPQCCQWSQWSQYGQCSNSCGGGQCRRQRTCSCGQDGACSGNAVETKSCNSNPCPSWGQWGAWSSCSGQCGLAGTQSCSRTCSVANGCSGQSTQTRPCQSNEVCAQWSQWSSNDQCSVTCGQGTTTRHRTCKLSGSAAAGTYSGAAAQCSGKSQETMRCVGAAGAQCCQYSAWSAWGQCSNSCGGGQCARQRTCSCQGYNACTGQASEQKACNSQTCPSWNQWSSWSACTSQCGQPGTQSCARTCSSYGKCSGDASKQRSCQNQDVCAQWSEWAVTGACSVSCGTGQAQRTRQCHKTGAAAAGTYTGAVNCPGAASDIVQCTGSQGLQCAAPTQPTPQCSWTAWQTWSGCSVTCANGQRQRQRQCSCYGPQSCGGYGANQQSEACQLGPCGGYVNQQYSQFYAQRNNRNNEFS